MRGGIIDVTVMKNTIRWGSSKGFALPTVMIASIVMLIVLLSGLVSTSSVSTSLRQQYYTRLNNEAFASGYTRAQSCLNAFGSATWSNASPLRPDSGCGGGAQCTTGPTCYVLSTNNLKTTFTVNGATSNSDGSYTIPITSEVQLFRTSQTTTPSQSLPNTGYARAVPLYWRAVSAGTRFTCGLTLSTNPTYDKKVKCWGANSGLYRLGNKTSDASLVPTDVAADGVLKGLSIKKIESGMSVSCVIASDDNAYCWGHNGQYGLGDNTTSTRTSPVAVYRSGVLSGLTIKDIAVGLNHIQCVVASNDRVYCWGENLYGSVGDNTTTPRSAPVAVYSAGVLSGKTISSVSAGASSACAVDSTGKVYCWGNGVLGNGSLGSSAVPVAVTSTGALSGKVVTDVSIGNGFACALATDGKAYCWGGNNYGQLGTGNTTASYVPVAVTGLNGISFTQLTAGNLWACGLTTTGTVYCWGRDGELSGTYVINSTSPLAINTSGVLAGKTITSISAGYEQTCALDTEGKKYCWGGNSSGAFGNGGTTGSINPVTTFNTWLTLQY